MDGTRGASVGDINNNLEKAEKMREWFIVSMFLIVTVAFYFALLTKIENVQTDVQIIQTQIGSTICMSLEQADNKTDMEENN